jgi:hypothetical protein
LARYAVGVSLNIPSDACVEQPQLLKCSSCEVEKVGSDFHKNPSKKSGRESHCKVCISLRKKAKRTKKAVENSVKAERRRHTNVYNVNDYVIEEVYAESGFQDRAIIEQLLNSFALSIGG